MTATVSLQRQYPVTQAWTILFEICFREIVGMETAKSEVKQIAAQILAGMLANPHIYASVSDEKGRGRQEQDLIVVAIEIAQSLIEQVEKI
jgi:hypothetical protein